MPYITASIILQSLTVAAAALEKLQKEGNSAGARSRSANASWATAGRGPSIVVGLLRANENIYTNTFTTD
jgi:hypothetical protein